MAAALAAGAASMGAMAAKKAPKWAAAGEDVPFYPAGLVASSKKGGEVKLEWDALEGAGAYAVMRRELWDDWKEVKVVRPEPASPQPLETAQEGQGRPAVESLPAQREAAPERLSFEQQGLSKSTVWEYQVVARAYAGKGKWKDAAQSTKVAVQAKKGANPTGITAGKASISLDEGGKADAEAEVEGKTPEDVAKVRWSSSDSSVAKVSKSGKVEAVGAGKAHLTARASNGLKARIDVYVGGGEGSPSQGGADVPSASNTGASAGSSSQAGQGAQQQAQPSSQGTNRIIE